MSRVDPQIKLRLPADLKDTLAEAAAANNRSLNAELVSRLEESCTDNPRRMIDKHTLVLFAEKVGQVLDERENKRKGRKV